MNTKKMLSVMKLLYLRKNVLTCIIGDTIYIYIYIHIYIEPLGRLKKWYLMPPCLTLSTIRYISRVKWSNPGKGVAPSPTPQCSSF